LIAVLIALTGCGDPSLAFQERLLGEVGDGRAGLPAGLQLPGIDLTPPQPGSGGGTEIRVPGVGSVGALPKLDFGLELLYGGNDTVGRFDERSQPSDVQIRATIKHRF
jgi:hypothetical protein